MKHNFHKRKLDIMKPKPLMKNFIEQLRLIGMGLDNNIIYQTLMLTCALRIRYTDSV